MDMEEELALLTEENKAAINEKLNSNAEKYEDVQIVKSLPSNNGIETSTTSTEGESKLVEVSVDPVTGQKTVIGTVDGTKTSTAAMTIIDKLSELGDAADKIELDDPVLTPEDIKKAIETDVFTNEKHEISDETCLELLKLINKYKEEKIDITYNSLPNQIKGFVDEYLKNQGVNGHSISVNTIRNGLAKSLVDEFIANASINKYTDEMNEQIEHVYDQAGEEISPIIKDYNNSKAEMLKKACESITDDAKKALMEKILDSINDAYELTRFKNAARSIKIKHYDMEEPQKIFNYFNSKYDNNKKYHVYEMNMVYSVLSRHMKEVITDDTNPNEIALKFCLGFCKFVQNYDPNIMDQHTFMYYVTYNIILLDIYKGEQYDEFAPKFLNNIYEIVKNFR